MKMVKAVVNTGSIFMLYKVMTQNGRTMGFTMSLFSKIPAGSELVLSRKAYKWVKFIIPVMTGARLSRSN